MSPKLIAISVLGALTTGALLMLFLDVREAPARPSEAKIADARTKHKRVAQPAGPANDPWAPSARGEGGGGDARATEPDPPAPTTSEPRLGMPSAPGVIDKGEPPPMASDRTDLGKPQDSITLDEDPRGELLQAREEANRLYDRQDYEAAIGVAEKVLAKAPDDIRMLRVVVSSSCQMGDADKAKKYWGSLPEHDKNQMTRRCQRFGITFTE